MVIMLNLKYGLKLHATAMGLGTAVGGWKIIKTVGGNIMKIRPANGAAADISSALTIS